MYLEKIEKLKKLFPDIEEEIFQPASTGTHHKVFVSDNFVARFRNEKPNLLAREAEFLKRLDHLLIPQVLWFGDVGGVNVMVENKLPGEVLVNTWKDMNDEERKVFSTDVKQNAPCFLANLFAKVVLPDPGRPQMRYIIVKTYEQLISLIWQPSRQLLIYLFKWVIVKRYLSKVDHCVLYTMEKAC